MTEAKHPRIWLLLGPRRGDNNQLLALGEGLGLPFETRTLAYRKSARAIMKLAPSSIAHVTLRSRSWLEPPWPDLVIGIGRRSVPVARWIREQSGGSARLVRLGHPRAPSNWFDLVLTTHQYPVRAAANVVRLPLAMNRFARPPDPTAAERRLLDSLPRPHFLLSLGGSAPMWRLDHAALAEAVETLLARARRERGTLIVISSPRTSSESLELVRSAIGEDPAGVISGDELRYPVVLSDADEHFVTAASVSMISEAIGTGKPVGLIPVEPDTRGQLRLSPDHDDGRLRDPRRFWRHVESLGLAGTVAHPRKGRVGDPVQIAIDAIRERLGAEFVASR